MGQVDIQKFNSEMIAELQARVTELENMVNNLQHFSENQIAINEFFRRIVDDKYTKEDLLAIYNRDQERKKERMEKAKEKINDEFGVKSDESNDNLETDPDEKC